MAITTKVLANILWGYCSVLDGYATIAAAIGCDVEAAELRKTNRTQRAIARRLHARDEALDVPSRKPGGDPDRDVDEMDAEEGGDRLDS